MTGTVSIRCADDVEIKGRWFRAQGCAAATVVVAPGAAAEARFYVPFCEYLASTGVDAFVFDFRTIGESAVDSLERRASCFTSWIEQDFPAVIAHAREHSRARPLVVIGHSAGGWMAGVQPATDRIDALIGVAALSGHWRHMARPHRYAHWLAWHVVVPIACRVFGTWPGLIGFRKAMAPRFGLEFSRWARNREFVFSESRFAGNPERFCGELHLFQIADDPWGTEAAVAAFSRKFPNASRCAIETIPRDPVSRTPIGHFGVFRKENAETLWPRLSLAVHRCAKTISDVTFPPLQRVGAR